MSVWEQILIDLRNIIQDSETFHDVDVYYDESEMNPNISTRAIISFFEKKLLEAFESNVHVFLIIDELSYDQKETIKNIIGRIVQAIKNIVKKIGEFIKLAGQKIKSIASKIL